MHLVGFIVRREVIPNLLQVLEAYVYISDFVYAVNEH